MDQAKVIEFLNQALVSDYLHKLFSTKLKKLVLFTVFPITHAANISDPRYFIMIDNPEALFDLKKADLN